MGNFEFNEKMNEDYEQQSEKVNINNNVINGIIKIKNNNL